MMRGEQGQVALEFITTYGWAIMVVLMVIAVMAYYGFIQTDAFLPEYCQLEPAGISCVEFGASKSGDTIRFGLQNNLAEDIQWANVTLESAYCDNTPVTQTYGATYNGRRLLQSGEVATTAFPCTSLSSSKIKGNMRVEFLKINEKTTHVASGNWQINAGE